MKRTEIISVEVAMLLQCGEWERHVPEVRKLVRAACRKAIGAAGAHIPHNGASVSVALADDDFVRDLNRAYRGQDKATNILSFPAQKLICHPRGSGSLSQDSRQPLRDIGGNDNNGDEFPLGDLALAWQTVRREAEEQGKAVAEHLSHLLVHGCLHLLGFDHEEEKDAEAMEGLEIAILGTMGIANPYDLRN